MFFVDFFWEEDLSNFAGGAVATVGYFLKFQICKINFPIVCGGGEGGTFFKKLWRVFEIYRFPG